MAKEYFENKPDKIQKTSSVDNLENVNRLSNAGLEIIEMELNL